ncbi:unnamed protein product [Nezara viridula]|uniref:Uncharacterized protein n=1 Tax=Nezara viridula TaxID=85310 RepID=A0A9P0H529_NEZVI|nr:unnamed protein product [Nezara viridula]
MTTTEISAECVDKRPADRVYHPLYSPLHISLCPTQYLTRVVPQRTCVVPPFGSQHHVSPGEVSSRRVRLRGDALLAEDLRALHCRPQRRA